MRPNDTHKAAASQPRSKTPRQKVSLKLISFKVWSNRSAASSRFRLNSEI
jgi:hypothetical protein